MSPVASAQFWPYLKRQELTGAFFRPGMQVTSGGGDTRMTQGGLHQMNGRAAIQSMRSMGVPQPVRGNGNFDSGPPGRPFYNAPDAGVRQRLSPFA